METFDEVMKKPWPKDIANRMSNEPYPFMLAMEDDFDKFGPARHRWRVVWFSDLPDRPQDLWRVFSAIARKVQRDEDLFDYLKGISRKAKYQAFSNCIEIKPGIFGISVDVRAIMEEMLGLTELG